MSEVKAAAQTVAGETGAMHTEATPPPGATPTPQASARARQHRRVLDALTGADVRHVLLRGDPGSGDDLDLLVHPGDVGSVARTLATVGLRPAPSEHHWPHRLFVGRHEGVDVVVDVLDRVVIRTALLGGRNVAARLVESASVDAEGVHRLAPAAAAWIRVVHAALSGRPVAVTGSPVDALDGNAVVARSIERALGAGAVRKVQAALSAGRGDEAVRLLRPLASKAWPGGERVHRAAVRWRGRLPGAAAVPAGARMVLLGPDGAGKSTLSNGLALTLPMPVHEIYMGVFRMDPWQKITRFVPGLGLASRLVRLRWRVGKAGYFARRGHVVVFDRYSYDAGLRPGKRGLRARLSYFFLERALPDPDVVLVLDCPGEVMFARKREHDVETLEERRGWYLAMAASLPNAVVIDATQPAQRVLEEARAAVWRVLQPA